ncbi:limbic system-associated membrane protein-like [Diadema antillarum]|uniref:limbic system-associated membrane protein-like n=1 Tax=Diadema antillarum TaxID=105358 RepID=UPI003A8AA31E
MAPPIVQCSLTWCLLLVCVLYQWSTADGDCTAPMPRFRSVSENKTATEGSSVTFPCILAGNTDNCNVFWHHRKSINPGPNTLILLGNEVSGGDIRYTADVNLAMNPPSSNITIGRLRRGDTGTFICQVKRTEDGCSVSMEFQLVVEYRAIINYIGPRNAPYWSVDSPGKLSYNESDTAYLTCNATGEPKPTIAWFRETSTGKLDKIILKENTNDVLTANLTNITREQSGKYRCEALNPSGPMVYEIVELEVQYAPSVVLNGSNEVSRAPGQDAYLKCDVTAFPPPVVYWMKNFTRLPPASNDPDTRKLIFKTVKPEDYGNYTCVATNVVGTAEATVELHGRPRQPTITNEDSQGTRRHTFLVKWSPASHPYPIPVTHYSIQRQRIEITESGEVLLLPSPPLTKTAPGATTCYRMTDLQPDSQYRVRVCPVNDYGIGDCTPFFRFNTSEYDDQQEPLQQLFDGQCIDGTTSTLIPTSRDPDCPRHKMQGSLGVVASGEPPGGYSAKVSVKMLAG